MLKIAVKNFRVIMNLQVTNDIIKKILHRRTLVPYNQQLRFKGYRDHCEQQTPRCSPEKLAQSECAKTKKAIEKGEKKANPFKSFWENPECCQETCADMLPRFDDLYYVISDKLKRKYAQTWVECPSPLKKPKVICCFDKLELPPIIKREKGLKGKTAEQFKDECGVKKGGSCPRARIPGCKEARFPPKCFAIKPRADCKKICTPYPSYSECDKDKVKPKRATECNCVRNYSKCDLYAMMRGGLIKVKKFKAFP